jgi:ABC-type Fe3+-citrate transport system substrate-binding protein
LGRSKKLRKKIVQWERLIVEHRQKIAKELAKPRANQGRIRKWEKEIANWRRQIDRARRRLPGRSQKGK